MPRDLLAEPQPTEAVGRDLFATAPAQEQAPKDLFADAQTAGRDLFAEVSAEGSDLFEMAGVQPDAEPASFMDQIGGGIDQVQSSFQKTGAMLAEKVGADEYAAELRADAAANDAEAAKVQYEAKHGDTGWKQALNLADPEWWKSVVAESLPSSGPFLAGAGAGAVAGGSVGGPVGAIIGAGLGGGSAVVLQEVGPAYEEYLNKHPDDTEGATDYALKKAGLSGVVNALSVALGPLGYGAGPVKHSLIQMALQPAVGVADTVSGNAMEKEYVDPETDLSRGVAKTAVGEIAVDAPGTIAVARQAMQSDAAPSEVRTPNAEEATHQPQEVRTEVRTPNAGDAIAEPSMPVDLLADDVAVEDGGNNTASYGRESAMNTAEMLPESTVAEIDQEMPKVPEPAATIDAQMEAFADGRKPAVLITEGEQMPAVIPEGAKTYDIDGVGTVVFKDDATLAQALNSETRGLALGYGVGAKPENPTGVVVSRDATGRIVAEQVTDAANPEIHQPIMEAAQRLAGENGTVELQSVDKVLQQRQQANNSTENISDDGGIPARDNSSTVGTAPKELTPVAAPQIEEQNNGALIISGDAVRDTLMAARIRYAPRKGGSAYVAKKYAAKARAEFDMMPQESPSVASETDYQPDQILTEMQARGMRFRKGEAELFNAGDDDTIKAVGDRVMRKLEEQGARRESFESINRGDAFAFQGEQSPSGRTIRTVDLPDSLSNAHTHTTLAKLKGKKDSPERALYQAAKTDGDNSAAMATIDRVIKPEKVEAMRGVLDPNRPVYIVPVINTEGNAVNRLPVAYARRLAQALGGKVSVSIVKTQGTPNTDEKADARLTKQISFDGVIPDTEGQYIIADDNFTSGRTVMALLEHIKAQGGDVRVIGTLASSRYGYGIKPREGAIEKLLERAGLNKSEMKEIMGHDVEQLTNAEINNLRLTTKRGPEGIRSRYAAQRGTGSARRDGQDRSAEGNQSTREGIELLPQSSGALLIKGDRKSIAKQLQQAGIKTKGVPHRDGVLFGKSNAGHVRAALETPTEAEAVDALGEVVKSQHDAVRGLSWETIKGFAKDKRRILMGVLTNLQLVEVYSKTFRGMEGGNPLTNYADHLQRLEAERNGALHEAELVDQSWDKLTPKQADHLGKLMHDATLYAVHPDAPFESAMPELQEKLKQVRSEEEAAEVGREIDNERQREQAYPSLRKRYQMLGKDAQAVYRNVRDLYSEQWNKTRDELINRVARTVSDEGLRKRSMNEIRLAFMKAITRGPYFPLSRFGDFVVIARKGDDYIRDHYETSHKQNRAAEKYRKAGFEVTELKGEEFSPGDLGNAPDFAKDVFALLEKHGMQNVDLMDDINQLMLRMMPDMSALKHSIHRKRVKGYSGDARRAFAHTIFHGAHHLSRIMYADRMQNEINRIKEEIGKLQAGQDSVIEDGNLAADLLNEMKARHEKIMNPNSHPLTSWLGSLGFLWYLGGSPAAGLVNMTQTALVTLPMLGGRHGWKKATAALMRAAKDYARAPFKAGTYEAWVSLDRSKLLSRDERGLIDELLKDGTLDITQAHALAQLAETDTRHQAKGEMSRGRTKAMRYVGAFFHNAEVANRQISALAAYRLARSAGESHQQAVGYARKVVFDSHFNYASSNRPRYMKGDVVRVLTMFKQYSQHMTYALVRNFNQGFVGESPEVRSQARKTLAGILGMHAVFAGSIGLPLASAIFSTLDLAFDDDDEPFDSRTAFRNWLADTFGTKTGEAIAKGVGNAYSPIDLHSRVSLGELWLRTPDRDMNGRDEALYYLEQAAGPIGALFLNVWSGAASVAEGEVQRGFEKMVPKFVRDFARAARYHDEGLRSYRGDPIIEDTTPAEEMAQALGFSPARASERYEARSAVKNMQSRIDRRRGQLLDWYAESIRDGDTTKQGDVIKMIQRFNEKNPARAVDTKALKHSMKTRARISGQTDRGVYLPKGSKHLMEQGRFAE